MEDKIDPVFRNIINKTYPPSSNASTHLKCGNKKSKISNLKEAEKKYDCIVYTKDSKLLRDKGIIINSVLPSFVTASANLCQIIQMSAMAEVTKIEAPGIDRLH